MSVHYTFNWPKGPQDVILTGTFDNWSQSLPLVKQADGSFSLQLPLPPKKEDILYKYVVDGQWKVNPNEKSSKDSEGNYNNVIEAEDLKELLVVPGALIPETGLAFANNNGEKLPSHQDNDLKTTVMPKEEPHHASIAGEPGIYVPKDEEQLNAFRTFETQDVKKLNEEETPQEYTQGITPAAVALSEQHDHIGSNATGEHTKEVLDHEKPEDVIGSNKEPVRQSVSGGITPAAIALAEEHNHVGPNASGEHTKEVLEGKDEYLSPEEKKKQKKKVKRSQYKAKKKKRDAEAAAAGGNVATSTEEEFTPEPESSNTHDTSGNVIGVSVPRTTRKSFSLDPESNRDEDVVPSTETFDNQQKTTRESFSHAVPAETEETALAPTDEEQKHDHSNAAAIAAGALGGGAVGTGLASHADSQSQPKTLDPKATSPTEQPPFGTDHLNEGKEVDAAPIGEKARETSQVVPVAGGVVGGGSNQPSVAEPSSGVTTEPTTTSAPETKDIPSTQKVVPLLPTEGVDPKATTATTETPVVGSETTKSPVTSSAAIANDEEIIIAASGNRKDIEAAVEAEEGHDVTLEEITPTKSEREELTREAEIASHAKGPITIEQVVVPQSDLHPHDEIAAATAPTSNISKSKDATTTPKEATAKPTETTSKKQTSSQTTSGNKQQAKKSATSEAKKEEKKKGGFRGFLKKLVT